MKSFYVLLFISAILISLPVVITDAKAQDVDPDLSKFKTVKPIQPNNNHSIPLIDYIRRLPGVRVMNQGGIFKIQLRGSSSLLDDSSPLFVLDGRYISSFEELRQTVDVVDIASIDVVKGSAAGIRYGMRGGNGAIIIKTQ